MSADLIQNKLKQFNEFFSIKHLFNVNIAIADPLKTPDFEAFLQQIPLPFQIASDIVNLDHMALKPLQSMSSVAGQLVEYLHHQTQKIDLLVGYIISQQDDEKHRVQGVSFGGGGIVFSSAETFKLGQLLELKIFLHNNTCAIYAVGEVIEREANETSNTASNDYKVVFHFIRENDREILVRNSLHEQAKQLQNLSKTRKPQGT